MENTWLSALLAWVLPAVIFVGVWLILMRRVGPQHGLMAIGKSTFGLYWSSVYEHLAWKRSRPVASPAPVATPTEAA